jgi:hypothetical protein
LESKAQDHEIQYAIALDSEKFYRGKLDESNNKLNDLKEITTALATTQNPKLISEIAAFILNGQNQ